MKVMYRLTFPAVVLGMAMTSALGQSTPQSGYSEGTAQPSPTIPAAQSSQAAQSANQAGTMNPSDNSTYATGKPLAGQSREGFWGHLNPFARKKWVNRQVDPIKERTNELDQLQAKNATDIRDVDARSQAGINHALTSANAADQHALDARSRADQAQGTATDASNRTASLNGVVSNLDQYQTVVAAPVVFAAGRTTLGPKGRSEVDELASKLTGEKGYIIEVQGYSRGGVQASQAMADSVVRYLVTEHQVPLYRIYRTGLGKNTQRSVVGGKSLANGVLVSLMQNSLAAMPDTSASLQPAATGASRPVDR